MAIASRLLTITQGNLDNSHFYLTEVMDMFPDDAVGGADESQAAPRTVRVLWGDESVDTDIVREKHIFRRRGWVRQFFSSNRVTAGNLVSLEQIEPYLYRVSVVPATATPGGTPRGP
jgi:DNA polymerase-3 subunit epsilon